MALLAASPALSCSIVVPQGYEGSALHRQHVREAIANATAIIDGEVVRPGGYGQPPALVYAHQVLKGPREHWFAVGTNGNDSCAIELSRPGERMRMILSDGPLEYVLYRDQSDARLEDRILRSDRRRVFPYFAGPRSPNSNARHAGD